MITLQRLNVVRMVDSEENAAKLEAKGFKRIGGAAEKAATTVTEDDLAKMGETVLAQVDKKLKDAAAKAAPADDKGKAAKDGNKEDKDGTSGQSDSGDGSK